MIWCSWACIFKLLQIQSVLLLTHSKREETRGGKRGREKYAIVFSQNRKHLWVFVYFFPRVFGFAVFAWFLGSLIV
ncbi:hypothetical protein RchiOBHm_Chr5g0018791 [Rosa chinensis]|uniref:Secreted protein n=1 Tax=Rosa chinensis TaxID=74649 RepID=A0A2P6Q6T4_ROSCH|nr:hypothetical protein RchiOBHm_Chr5g0018791 [Rosa chinensis]